jgi:LPXTG-motif cell wall-anchored protein
MKLTKHRETRTTHYRTWKSGKKWIYSASMLATMLTATVIAASPSFLPLGNIVVYAATSTSGYITSPVDGLTKTTPKSTMDYNIVGEAGDVFVVTGTNNSLATFGKVTPPPESAATISTVTNGNIVTTTITLKQAGTYSIPQAIEMRANTNGNSTSNQMDAHDPNPLTASITKNGAAYDELSVTTTVSPSVSIYPPKRVSPSADAVPSLPTDTTVTYRMSPYYVPGTGNGTSYATSTGTMFGQTVTWPVPDGFEPDLDATKAISGNSGLEITWDKSTNTMTYVWPNGMVGSKTDISLVGKYTNTPPAGTTALTVTAATGPTITTIISADGTTITKSASPMTDKIRPKADQISTGDISPNFYPQTSTKTLEIGATNNVAITGFGVANSGTLPVDGMYVKFGFSSNQDITGLTTPALGYAGTSWKSMTKINYTITYRDGTTSTGSVTPGQYIKGNGQPIDNIVVTPDSWDLGEYTEIYPAYMADSQSKASADLQTQGKNSGFRSIGSLNDTAVAGDLARATMQFITPSGESSTIFSYDQDIVAPKTVIAGTVPQLAQTNTDTGVENAGSLTVQTQSLVFNLKESATERPSTNYTKFTGYFILPDTAIYNSGDQTFNFNYADGTTGTGTLSTFRASDGRQVIKVDMPHKEGTSITADAVNTATVALPLDLQTSGYQSITKNIEYISDIGTAQNITNDVVAPLYDGSTLLGDTSSTLSHVQDLPWTVAVASGVYTDAKAQGNDYSGFTTDSSSNGRGSSAINFQLPMINNSKNPVSGLTQVIDLPSGDDWVLNNSGTKATNGYDNIKVTSSDGSTPDVTITYLLNDGTEVAPENYTGDMTLVDKIRVLSNVDIPGMTTFTTTVYGSDPKIIEDSGKTLQATSTISATGLATVTSNPATVTIHTTSTVHARYHYVDADGKDQYIDIPTTDTTMTQSLKDNVDSLADHYSDESLLSDAAKALIPEGYEFINKSQTIINNTEDTSGDGAAELGGTSKYFYDGDIVQMELQPIIKEVGTDTQEVTRTIHYRYLRPELVSAYDASLDTTQVADDNVQTITFTRPKYENLATKEITYGPWTADSTGEENGQFTEITSPEAPLPKDLSFTPDQAKIASETVSAEDADSEITVYYDGPAQAARVIYWDESTGKQLETSDDLLGLTGQTDKSGYTTANTISKYEKLGYELVKDDEYKAGFTYDDDSDQDQVFNVYLKPRLVPLTPENPGTPGQPVDPSDPNSPNYPDGDYKALEDTVLETIHYVYEDGSKAAEDRTDKVQFTRTGTVNLVTGEIVYSDWIPVNDDDTFDSVISPIISGYTADTLVVGAVTNQALDPDTEITVVYKPVFTPPITPETPETPDEPETPDTPVTPETPDTPVTPETPEVPVSPTPPDTDLTTNIETGDVPPEASDKPKTPDTPEAPETPAEPTSEPVLSSPETPALDDTPLDDTPLVTSIDYPVIQNASGQKALPETGDETPTIFSSLGGALIALAGLLGFNKRRKHDN